MNKIKFLLVLSLLIVSPAIAVAQISTKKSDTQKWERLFTDKDRDFLQLWYYEQMLEMDLDEDERYDYLAVLHFYTYKMGHLTHPKYNYSEAELKQKFDELVAKINVEMKDYLNDKNFNIHQKNFGRIVELIYQKKGWELDD